MKMLITTLKCIAIVAMLSLFSCSDDQEVTPQIEEVQATSPPKTEVRISVPVKDFESVVAEVVGKGYVPCYIDGFIHRVGLGENSEPKTFFNIIFKEDDNTTETKYFQGLNKSGLETTIDLLRDTYNLTFLESYREDDQILFAAIFTMGEPTHFQTELKIPFDQWDTKFNQWTDAGYRMACRTMVREGSEWYVSALFDKTPVGNWISITSLDPDAMWQKILEQFSKERYVSHFDVVQGSSSQYAFGAIFDSETKTHVAIKKNMTSTELTSAIANYTNNGYVIQTLCAYDEKVITGDNWHFNTLYVASWEKYPDIQ